MKRLFLFSIMFLLWSCSKYKATEFEKNIMSNFESKCNISDSCSIKIKDVTKFQWDKMYVFKTNASLDDINKALGFKYPFYIDVAERVVFVNDNKIVYHDDYYLSFDRGIQNIIEFKLPDSLSYKSYGIDDAIFRIDKKQTENNDDYYFTLSQQKNQ